MNYLITLENWAHVPTGSIYRGDGKFDVVAEAVPVVAKVTRKEVKEDGTVLNAAVGETANTRMELRKLAQAEHRAQKQKAIKLRQDQIIAARYTDLSTRLSEATARRVENENDIASVQAQIIAIQADLVISEANLVARTTALATAQASLDTATTPAQITTRTATLATRQKQYDTALSSRDTDQGKLDARNVALVNQQATLVSRTATEANLIGP
jgi:chromosome segregation ATPase